MSSKPAEINEKNDLTSGPIVTKILRFVLPMIVGNLVMQLYNVVDSIVVGKFVGSDAIAAVGVSFPIMMLFSALFMGLSMGSNIVVSQTFGAKDMDRLQKSVNTIFTLAFGIGIFVTIIGLFLSRPLLDLLGTPENIIDDSATYLLIIFAGMLGNIFFNNGSGVLRGMGDSRWPLIALIVASVTNIVLDLVFVIVFGWGVAGVAWATTISQFLSGLIILWRINTGNYGVKISLKGILSPDKAAAASIIKLGIPSAIQSMAMSLGSVVIQSYANGFGSDLIAANTIIMKIDGFAVMPMMALGMSSTTFVGQNIGAGNAERAKKGVYVLLGMIAAVGVVLGVILLAFNKYFFYAFTDKEIVIEMGMRGISYIAFFYSFMGFDMAMSGAIRGAGVAAIPMVLAIVNMIIRIPLTYLLAVQANNYMGLFYAMSITMVTGTALTFLYFHFGKWREKGIKISAQPIAGQ
ncbi:MAG: MATE family efflux transporter [Oscillospiraceae bacterium]|jgi:putative MATE family efflux protein|nr:MATE family efflux transporter [Oscillospiraceae bacterium]